MSALQTVKFYQTGTFTVGNRLLAPEEVARAVTFLASGDSGMMTGSVINFDQSVWGAYDAGPPKPAKPLNE